MNRQELARRYLALQDEARRLGLTGTAHIASDMTDDEIIRRGKMLAQQVEKAKAIGKAS